MALSFGENLGVLGNIKLTDVKLVAGAFRTVASGSDTGSITVQRVENGQIIYIQSEDRLIRATKSGASVSWSPFFFPSASAGAETAGIFVVTGSSFNTTQDVEITGSLFSTTLTTGGNISGSLSSIGSFGSVFTPSHVTASGNISGSAISTGSFGIVQAQDGTFSDLQVTDDMTITDDLDVGGVLTATGGTIVGNAVTDTHNIIGHVTASGHVSGSNTSTGSFGKLLGDGSSLTGITTADLDSVFETDGNEDLMPSEGTEGLSVFYEYDSNDDIIPRT